MHDHPTLSTRPDHATLTDALVHDHLLTRQPEGPPSTGQRMGCAQHDRPLGHDRKNRHPQEQVQGRPLEHGAKDDDDRWRMQA